MLISHSIEIISYTINLINREMQNLRFLGYLHITIYIYII